MPDLWGKKKKKPQKYPKLNQTQNTKKQAKQTPKPLTQKGP